MKNTNKVILYQVYGPGYIYNQALFSILTLYHHLQGDFKDIKVVIYTDKPDFFSKYTTQMPISTEPLTKEILAKYKSHSGNRKECTQDYSTYDRCRFRPNKSFGCNIGINDKSSWDLYNRTRY